MYQGGPDSARQSVRRGLFVGLGLVGILCWFSDPMFHKPRDESFATVKWLHSWDSYHYYVGAKYFQELGGAVAGTEDPDTQFPFHISEGHIV